MLCLVSLHMTCHSKVGKTGWITLWKRWKLQSLQFGGFLCSIDCILLQHTTLELISNSFASLSTVRKWKGALRKLSLRFSLCYRKQFSQNYGKDIWFSTFVSRNKGRYSFQKQDPNSWNCRLYHFKELLQEELASISLFQLFSLQRGCWEPLTLNWIGEVSACKQLLRKFLL